MLAVALKNNIKNILVSKGWSIRKLSKVLDKDYAYVHRLVTTDPLPDGTTIGALAPIADVLGVSIDSLVSQEDDKAS